jgi:glucan phosphoethanolaminetransferase (alkaline phosphatase superfamily)
MKNLRSVGLIIIALGLLITLGIMISTTSPIGSLSDFLVTLGFYAWAALPFVVLIAVTFYIHRKGLSRPARISILVTSILVVVSSVLMYWASIFNSESSTSALAFIFIPFYALVASAVVHVLAWLLLRLFMTKSEV